MKLGNNKILKGLTLAFVAMLAVTLASCSDDDDGVVKVNFDENTISGNWKVTEMDSIEITETTKKALQNKTFQTVRYSNRYASFDKNAHSYEIRDIDASNTPATVERGTYTVVVGSFRIDLSSGRQLHWLKSDGNTMLLESYNASTETRRARYTLERTSN